MKRLCALFCASLLAMPFVACDDEEEENNPPANHENNSSTDDENNDPPKPGETEPGDKVAALEKRIRDIYRLEAFSFDGALDGGRISVVYDPSGNGSGEIRVSPADFFDDSIGDQAAIVAAIQKYFGDEFTYLTSDDFMVATRQVRRIYYTQGNLSEESQVFVERVNVTPAMLLFSPQFGYLDETKWSKYLALDLPSSIVQELAVLDGVAPGQYTASDGELRLDIFANGGVALDIGARIFVGADENTYYDLHVGHVADNGDEITDHYVYHYIDKVDYYAQVAMEIAARLKDEALTPVGAAHADAAAYIEAKGYSLLEWGDVTAEKISDPSNYELEGVNLYQPGWISDDQYQPAPLHASRQVQYIPENISDKIVRTQIERSNSIYDDDIGAQYTLYRRTIWLDPERVTQEDFDAILAAIQAQGITESANDTRDDYRRWAGAIQVGADGEDYYELAWNFDADNANNRMFKLTIEYWYDTLGV